MLPNNRKNMILLCLFGALISLMMFRLITSLPARADSLQSFTLTLKVEEDVYLFGPGRAVPDRPLDLVLKQAVRQDARGRITELLPLDFGYEYPGLDEMLEIIAERYRVDPLPARVEFSPDSQPMFSCSPGKPGKKLDLDAIRAAFSAALQSRASAVVEGKVTEDLGPLSEEIVRRSFFLRSAFSTDLSSSSADRRHNVRLALSRFHGKILYPGEQMSFNQITGPRTLENGFKPAKIIAGGKFTEGVGGGVCQSSTTLFNALLLGDVRIDESHPHSLAVGYVPPSLDAMVNFQTSDLVFTNDTGNLLYFRSVCSERSAGIEIYGQPLSYEIRRRSVTLRETPAPDPEIRPAQTPEEKALVTFSDEVVMISPSHGGLESESWLDYYRDGKLFRSRRVRKDRYAPYQGYGVRGLLPRSEPDPSVPADPETSAGWTGLPACPLARPDLPDRLFLLSLRGFSSPSGRPPVPEPFLTGAKPPLLCRPDRLWPSGRPGQ